MSVHVMEFDAHSTNSRRNALFLNETQRNGQFYSKSKYIWAEFDYLHFSAAFMKKIISNARLQHQSNIHGYEKEPLY